MEHQLQYAPDRQADRVPSQEHSSKQLLERLVIGWSSRAEVRRGTVHDQYHFDETRPDFLTENLPFHNHPRFKQLSEGEKALVLSYGWLIYCEKTIDIENRIVTPLCIDIIDGRVPYFRDEVSKKLACETMIDESYHVLLTIHANGITRKQRNITAQLQPSLLLQRVHSCLNSHPLEWQQWLIRFVACCVSEIFISDYLLLIADSEVVQPLHQQVTQAHRRDELAHGAIFRRLARNLYPQLTLEEQEFFQYLLPKSVSWFAEPDFPQWRRVFTQLGLADMDTLLAESQHGAAIHDAIDYSGIVELAHELGITHNSLTQQSFRNEGLAL